MLFKKTEVILEFYQIINSLIIYKLEFTKIECTSNKFWLKAIRNREQWNFVIKFCYCI